MQYLGLLVRLVTRLPRLSQKIPRTDFVVCGSLLMDRERGIPRVHRDVCRNVERTGFAAPVVAINEREVRPSD